ncbi:ribonuclease P [Halobacteriales archaeon QS_8_69_26]|nr:MAG: ribonuclease P [Halobacteriales archaeon QS_8_69_26]
MTEDRYEAAVAHPEGRSTVARLASTATESGYDGLVVRNADAVLAEDPTITDGDPPDHADAGEDYDPEDDGGYLRTVTAEYGVDVVSGVEIDVDDPSTAAGRLGNVRSRERTDYTVVAVAGGSEAMNRFAAESDRVDVLTRPLRRAGAVDHVVADEARDHGVRVEFDLSPVLRATGGRRVRALRDLRRLREIVLDRDAPFVVSARPDSHLRIRSPRELVAVGEAVGFDRETVEAGLREWGRLAGRNRERAGESFIEPGVERGRYEEDDR